MATIDSQADDDAPAKPVKDKKSGAPDCGLYIRIAPGFNFEETVARLRGVFFITTRSEYEKNMHVLELPMPAADAKIIEETRGLADFARRSGFVSILRGSATMAGLVEVDGILLEPEDDIAAARAIVGDDAIIGVRCGLNRGAAEAAEKAGADYVSFHAPDPKILIPTDIVSWWTTRSDVLALVEGNITNDNCGAYVRAGASFIDCGAYVLDHPVKVTQGAVDMMYAIDLAMNQKQVH